MTETELYSNYEAKIEQLGERVLQSTEETERLKLESPSAERRVFDSRATHVLVVSMAWRTEKLLCSVAAGMAIVGVNYVDESAAARGWQQLEERHLFSGKCDKKIDQRVLHKWSPGRGAMAGWLVALCPASKRGTASNFIDKRKPHGVHRISAYTVRPLGGAAGRQYESVRMRRTAQAVAPSQRPPAPHF